MTTRVHHVVEQPDAGIPICEPTIRDVLCRDRFTDRIDASLTKQPC